MFRNCKLFHLQTTSSMKRYLSLAHLTWRREMLSLPFCNMSPLICTPSLFVKVKPAHVCIVLPPMLLAIEFNGATNWNWTPSDHFHTSSKYVRNQSSSLLFPEPGRPWMNLKSGSECASAEEILLIWWFASSSCSYKQRRCTRSKTCHCCSFGLISELSNYCFQFL